MEETILYFKWEGVEKPIVKIADNGKDQVVLNFLSSEQEHLTLHLQKDGIILRNHWGQDKPKRSWDDERVEVARRLGYANPEKHGKYYIHSPIGSMSDSEPSHLVGRRISFNSAPTDKVKYKKLNKMTSNPSSETSMVHFYLYPKSISQNLPPSILTSLGNIVIKFEA